MPHGLRLSCANLVIAIPDLDGVERRQFIPAGSLVIPVRDVEGTLHSLQFITSKGDKQFLSGGRVAGCCYGLGSLDQQIWLCEGFATAATVFEATHEAVAVCFFAGNLQHVAEAVRRKYPRAELVICADNDRKTPGNPGLSAAKAVARRFMGRAVWPVFEEGTDGSDFNDLAQQIGIAGVREELRNVRSNSASISATWKPSRCVTCHPVRPTTHRGQGARGAGRAWAWQLALRVTRLTTDTSSIIPKKLLSVPFHRPGFTWRISKQWQGTSGVWCSNMLSSTSRPT
jgi:hypothetical protein